MNERFSSVTHLQDPFVAVGEAGAILTSPDGTSWTAKSSGTTNMLNNVVNNGDGTFTYKFTRGGYTLGDFVEF